MPDKTLRITAAEYKRSSSEYDMQRALFKWADAEKVLMYANANGQYRKGQRPEAGLKAGVPDVLVPLMRGEYGGLFLELKTASGRVSKAQWVWIDRLKREGYCVHVVRSLDQAVEIVQQYLSLSTPLHSLPNIDEVF